MRKIEFDILLKLFEEGCMTNEELAVELFKAETDIQEALEFLKKEEYIFNNQITEKGREKLREYPVDNAIILAAGMSSRFVPLSFEKPKGLLMVKGEPLIERQIKAIREKGIQEIVIVVGHMKEHFEYLVEKYGIILVESKEYKERNNHSSIYAARKYLKNSIITSSDLYFTKNIFQTYAYDSYYCTIYMSGKTAERGIETDNDDKILDTFYGDKCYDIWVTLGYAFFSKRFSEKMIEFLEKEYDKPETVNKFWADIQDEHLNDLYMYAKRCADDIIYEFDSLEELREFDDLYVDNSGSKIMQRICSYLNVSERNIIKLEALRKLKESMFKFKCKGELYICDTDSDEREKISYLGKMYYECRDFKEKGFKLFKMDKNIYIGGKKNMDLKKELEQLYEYSRSFRDYHKESVPLCAAENAISDFVMLPLSFGFQERYIMNNTYSFNMNDNFIGCEKLLPFYQKLSEVCERIFGAKYTDARPFTGMNAIDMIVKTICKNGEKMIILDKEHGGHASVKPVVERLGIQTFSAPYDLDKNDLDYEAVNKLIEEEKIPYILLAPSDLIKPLSVEKINTSNCILMWDCSQLLGLIAAGLCSNPLKTMKNIVMFGGTHKTLPGPASGLIMTNEKALHEKMETNINPKYLRHSQMHQKISLLFSLIEFEQFGTDYMKHMVHCANYLGNKLRELGFDIADIHGKISETHQVFIHCSKDMMDTIYDNAYKCKVTLNKKHKELFLGYGIRLGTQEIARYDWNDKALDTVAEILVQLSNKNLDIDKVEKLIETLPEKKIHYTFSNEIIEKFRKLVD